MIFVKYIVLLRGECMETAKDSTICQNRILGTIGFDRVTLTGLYGKIPPFQVPVSNVFPDRTILDKQISGYTLQASPKKIKIYGPDFIFSFGNQSDRGFAKIEIHASDETDENLMNLSVDMLIKRLFEINNEIKAIYGIDVVKDENTIRIYSAEINVTVPIEHKLDDYKRILKLLSFIDTKQKNKTAEYKSGNHELETFYIINGRTKNIKIYAKNTELESTKNIDCDCSLLRYEIYETEQNLSSISSNSDDHKLYLKDITQHDLEQHFIYIINEQFSKTDSYLEEQKRFPTQANDHFISLFSISLQHVLRTDPASFIESVLSYLKSKEDEVGTPIFLDIQDIVDAFSKTNVPDRIKDLFNKAIQDVSIHSDLYPEFSLGFIGQRTLYNELKTKLCQATRYRCLLYKTPDEYTSLIYWNNSNHTSNFPENSFEDMLLNKITKKKGAKYTLHKTSNKKEIFYIRERSIIQQDPSFQIPPSRQPYKVNIYILKESYVNLIKELYDTEEEQRIEKLKKNISDITDSVNDAFSY